MTRPSADESMLPPASTSTTRLPLSMSSRPARNAASGAAPGAFDDALLELDQAQDRERDRSLRRR